MMLMINLSLLTYFALGFIFNQLDNSFRQWCERNWFVQFCDNLLIESYWGCDCKICWFIVSWLNFSVRSFPDAHMNQNWYPRWLEQWAIIIWHLKGFIFLVKTLVWKGCELWTRFKGKSFTNGSINQINQWNNEK